MADDGCLGYERYPCKAFFFLEGDNGFPIVSADANSGRFE